MKQALLCLLLRKRWRKERSLRKLIILLAIVFLCSSGIAIAAWQITDSREDKTSESATAAGKSETFQSKLAEESGGNGDAAAAESTGEGEGQGGTTADASDSGGQTGEDFSYENPEQRYVTETQRHQNFFRALAEGRVVTLDITATDYRPVGDPNTSYVYFTIGTDSGSSTATMVFKYDNAMWRIAAINQLQGDLSGGTNYMVPSSFEDDLAREMSELQPFLAKVAEGRLEYMAVDSVSQPNENETILSGRVVSKGGMTVPAEMLLRKDYGLWHITSVTNPPA
jgi:hypothetical protein